MQVRIALIIDESGKWVAYGYSGATDADAMGNALDFMDESQGVEARYWITAEIAPPVTEIVGGVADRA